MEDSPDTGRAFDKRNTPNQVIVVTDGEGALDSLFASETASFRLDVGQSSRARPQCVNVPLLSRDSWLITAIIRSLLPVR